jgi:hypothetical protein
MDGDYFRGLATMLATQPGYAADALQAIDHLHRASGTQAYNAHGLQELQDYLSYYHIIADALAGRMEDHGTEHAVFFDIPHLFYDTMIYQVVRALGIPTLILRQSHLQEHFYSLTRIEDYGRLPVTASEAAPYPIDQSARETPYYMAGVKQEAGSRGSLTARGLGHLLTHVITRSPGRLLRPAALWKLIRRARDIARDFPDWRDPFASFFHTDHLAYFESLAEHENAEIDMTRRFVYFPLQMQPEMTTASLGGIYADQFLAIEHLAAMLPEDVRIYVKENPKQTGKQRGPMTFHRLKRIEKVDLMPSHANTHALTENALFVATISGTVGWEAITSGKPVLLFGATWYRDLPGVKEMRPDLTMAEILTPFEHRDLEQQTGQLLARAHPGVISRHAGRALEGHDEAANARDVAKVLHGLLKGEVPISFPGETP